MGRRVRPERARALEGPSMAAMTRVCQVAMPTIDPGFTSVSNAAAAFP